VLANDRPMQVPFAVRMLARYHLLRRIPARVVGMGFRPEHVRSPAASASVAA
jgi:hypothetical protein